MSSFNPLNVQIELRDDVEREFRQQLSDNSIISEHYQDYVLWLLARTFDKFCPAETERLEKAEREKEQKCLSQC